MFSWRDPFDAAMAVVLICFGLSVLALTSIPLVEILSRRCG